MNADSQFSEFVRRQQRPAAIDEAVDWGKQRDEWLDRLDRLYATVSGYLAAYVDAGQIEIRRSDVALNEENIGAYAATRLTIVIGAQEIMLTPIGTLLIGSKGRVDVEGSAGRTRLVLIDREVIDVSSMFKTDTTSGTPEPPKPAEWAWKIVSAPPAMRFVELNQESCLAMLMEVSNG